jgi:Fic family protein
LIFIKKETEKQIKEIFQENKSEMYNINEISNLLNIHRNTARRYLEELVSEDLLEELKKGNSRFFRLKLED